VTGLGAGADTTGRHPTHHHRITEFPATVHRNPTHVIDCSSTRDRLSNRTAAEAVVPRTQSKTMTPRRFRPACMSSYASATWSSVYSLVTSSSSLS
jgi:hypothetical protein